MTFAQKPTPDSSSRDEPTRARTVGESKSAKQSDAGPMIRIALMRDVTSVVLDSPSGLRVRRSTSSAAAQVIASGQVRVEASKSKLETGPTHRVVVALVSDLRRARKIVEDLESKFFEPASTAFDPGPGVYVVWLGALTTKADAVELLARVRRSGYPDARLDSAEGREPSGTDTGASERRASPSVRLSTAATGSTRPPDRSNTSREAPNPGPRLAAFESGRLIASGEDLLVIVPMTQTEAAKSGDRGRSSNAPATDPGDSVPALRIANKSYRGEIRLVLTRRGTIDVINALPLEEYLRGVVPLELPPRSYPEIEALKAQAIAARSYALSHMGRFASEGFDLYGDARSQIYGGLSAEMPLTDRAVEETRGVAVVQRDDDGRYVPIEALYTADCGGRTENNDAVFLTKPLSYLRSVDCVAASLDLSSHEIRSDQAASAEDRSMARDIAILKVLEFRLPQRVTAQYLQSPAGQDEVVRWLDRLSVLGSAKGKRAIEPPGDVTRLPRFASLLAASVYGGGQTAVLMTQADIDYTLSGLDLVDLSPDDRVAVARLLRDGLISLPEGRTGSGSTLTRGYVLQTVARVAFLKTNLSGLRSGVAAPAEKGRLVIAPPARSSDTKTKLETKPATAKPGASGVSGQADAPIALDVGKSAMLFRRSAGESYATASLVLVGGEPLTYHVDSAGRVDFLEAGFSPRGAAVTGVAGHAPWRERIGAGELSARLARARVDVGELKSLTPTVYGESGRVLEMEVKGTRGDATLRGYQVRSVLGLKESLITVEEERDDRSHLTGVVFVGRGVGHGVGMCQLGAYTLARRGRSFTEILVTFYRGAEVREIY